MKKLLILVLTLFSLEGFSANYEIVKDPAVKISKQDIQKNNKSIEEAIKGEYAWNSESDLLVSRRNEAIDEYKNFEKAKVEVDKKFKSKMGYLPEDFRENVKNKEEVRKVYEEYRDLMKKELLSKRKEIESAEEGSLEVFYTVEKKNNKWTVIERHARVN